MEMAEALRDREATIRSYTDHVTHELKTPVSAIRAAVELMQDGGGLAEADARLAGEIDGAREQIEAQLAALRAAASAREARYLGQTRLSDLPLDHTGLRIEMTGAEVALPIGAEGLELVLGHLMQNAAEHGAGAVHLAATRTGGRVVLDIADDGPGISAGNATRVFEPFFTTRRDGGGTGMGLTIVRNLLAAHRGRIELVPSKSGARFRISFAG
jgi:signal transduction histidine kinase